MAADRPVDIALLHHFLASRLFCRHYVRWGGLDAGYGVAETP